jgi:glycine betaine/proline transport system permease protein
MWLKLRERDYEGFLPWVVVLLITAISLYWRADYGWLIEIPDSWLIPVSDWINTGMDWFVSTFKWVFRGFSWLLNWPLIGLRDFLQWLPWPATITVFCTLAYVASGWRLSLFTALSFGYMVITGYWEPSMNTLAVVFISIPLAIGIGFMLAIGAYRSERVNRIVQPTLDLMQTVPTFAYLIPILLLFGFGPVVGVVASAIYACPPMVRNMILGLQKVPAEVLEGGLMSGATKRQLFWWVQVPSALQNIMIGINQATMAALSMVIIAAIIGSSADIGWEVLSTMRKAQFGQSLLAGIVIALIAMVLDRISWGFSDRTRAIERSHLPPRLRYRPWLIAIGLMVFFSLLSIVIPFFSAFPEAWVVFPADPINKGLTYITIHYSHVTDSIKNTVYFYFLLPLRIGFVKAISPFSWGFVLTSGMIWGYSLFCSLLAIWLFFRQGWQVAIAAVIISGTLFFGITAVPWIAFILIASLIAWQVGGWKIASLSLLGWSFMLLSGVWPQAMLSVYMCLAAVIVCLILGGTLGIWASQNQVVSNFLRPINDTLQTMPLFVILIPFLMFFQIGEFTAFLAIIAYAIVPTIRYTEHGLRNVPVDTIEAAQSMGCTRRQILWEVKVPLATPEIMLGLNQTVMFALAMLVISALVGTKGLGQSVYIALGSADTGLGLVAGLSMALIAIITDRIIQSWSLKRKRALGLSH